MQQLNLEIARLDHLGIIASTIKDLWIVKMINDRIGVSKQEVISTGENVEKKITLHSIKYTINEQHNNVNNEQKIYTLTATITLLENAKLKYIEHNSCYVIGTKNNENFKYKYDI